MLVNNGPHLPPGVKGVKGAKCITCKEPYLTTYLCLFCDKLHRRRW